MAYLVGWLITTILALITLPFLKATIFGLIMLVVTQIGAGVVMLPFGFGLSIFEKDVLRRRKIIDKYFILFQFIACLIVMYFSYLYSTLLPISVIGGYLHWYYSYKYQEKKYKESFNNEE